MGCAKDPPCLDKKSSSDIPNSTTLSQHPRGTLMEPSLYTVLKQSDASSVQPTGSSQTTLQPSQCWWKFCGILIEPGPWNLRGTSVEPWWKPRGTLPQGCPGPPRSLSGLRPQKLGKAATTAYKGTKIISGSTPHFPGYSPKQLWSEFS